MCGVGDVENATSMPVVAHSGGPRTGRPDRVGRLPGVRPVPRFASYDRGVTPDLATTLENLPARPGVYLMRDGRGIVLYVGKAQSLRNRVRSYWQKQSPYGEAHRIRTVIDRVADVEYTLTDSVAEALLLEANLIKRFKPRFNVRLKDDKSYPYIKISLGEDFPRIERTRKLVEDGSRYFGPYASASSVDESMNLIRRLFPFRTCTLDIREGKRALQRPCLLYHIKRCQGPCIEAISRAAYRADIAQVELFLEGRQETVARGLRREMEAASERTDYERAAALRDKVRSIERTMEDQKMAAFARTEQDVLGLARAGGQAAVQLFVVRNGSMIGRDVFLLEADPSAGDDEVLAGFVGQYYARASSVPPALLLPTLPTDAADLEAFLAARRGRRVRLLVPAARARSGGSMELAAPECRRDAGPRAGPMARRRRARRSSRSRSSPAPSAWPRCPLRIECYDISTFQGSQTVGQHGRLRGRQAAHRRVPPVPDPRRRRPGRLRQPRGDAPSPPPSCEGGRGGQRGGAALDAARPDRRGRGEGPAQRRCRGPGRARTARRSRSSALPRSARSSSCPGGPIRWCSRRHRRRSTSSSGCATRPTASRSPTTGTCAGRRR